MAACSTCGADNPSIARFCMRCGALIGEQTTSRDIRKTVTILFADVTGFTPLGERLDVESLRAVMARYFASMREAVERHEGTVAKFIGDAVMAVFGLEQVHEDDALRAVRAAVDMGEALRRLNPALARDHGVTLAIRIGVNTGEVVVSDAPSGADLVVGDAVNVASRLEEAVQPGEVVLGMATYRLVRDAVEIEAMEPQRLKGKAVPVDAVRLLRLRPGAPALARRLDAPMVGRRRELATLQQAFARAVSDSACHLVTVLGSAGVGKSRLIEELLRGIDGQARVLRGHCVSYGEGITYLPVQELVRDAAEIAGEDPPEVAIARLRALVAGLGESEVIVNELAALLGLPGFLPAPEQTQWAVRKLVEWLAGRQPLIVVFDDVHWGESSFLDLVEHIAEWSRGVPILLTCTARQELFEARPNWGGGKLNATTMLLEPLTAQESGALLGDLVGEAQLSTPILTRIVESAEGNPLFLEEMLAMLIDDHILVRRDGHWLASGDQAALSLPVSIRALLAARLERLSREERLVIERAAVVGRIFDQQAIVQLCPEGIKTLAPSHLQALIRKDLIRPDTSARRDDVFRFRHPLIRDAAYEAIAKQARSELHQRFAEWLQKGAGHGRESTELAGYHLEQAYRYRLELGPPDASALEVGRESAALLAAAGRRAAARGDMPAAAGLLSRASGLLAEDVRARLTVLPELGAALLEAGDFARAGAVLAEAVEGAARFGDRRLGTYARLEHERLQMTIDPEGSSERALDVAEAAIGVFSPEGGDRGLALAWQLRADVYLVRGQLSRQLDALQHALAHAQRLAERRLEGAIQIAMTATLIFGPTPAPACEAHCQQALEWARLNGSRPLEAIALDGLALLDAMAGRFARARELTHEGRSIVEDLGLKVQLGNMSLAAGAIEMLAGDTAGAERELRHGVDLLRQAGEKAVLSTVIAELADAVYAQGRYREALELTQASEATSASDDTFSQALWRAVQAKVHARQGRIDHALAMAGQAVAIAQRTEYLELQARAEASRGEVDELAGNLDEAARARERGARLYAAKGNQVMRDRLTGVLQKG